MVVKQELEFRTEPKTFSGRAEKFVWERFFKPLRTAIRQENTPDTGQDRDLIDGVNSLRIFLLVPIGILYLGSKGIYHVSNTSEKLVRRIFSK